MPINWQVAEQSLGDIMARYYPALVERAYTDAEADLGRAIPRDGKAMDALTAAIAERVQGITATQRDRIATLVNQYTGDRAGLRAALQEAIGSKADEVSATEVYQTYNLGVAQAAKQAGLARVYVTDGDGDGPCAAVHGTYQTLDWAEGNPLGHPRCQRRFLLSED